MIRWRWIFPSRWLTVFKPVFDTVTLQRLPGEFLALFFPADCRVCSTPLKHFSRIPVCGDCLKKPEPFLADYFCARCRAPFLNSAPLDENGYCLLCRRGAVGFDAAYSFGEYTGELRKLILLFKYEGVTPLSPVLGAMLTRALPRDIEFDLLAPMPLHWTRLWKRGFNQAELLAKVISSRTGIPCVNAIRRSRATPHQAGLTRAERRVNVSGVFEVRKPGQVSGKHVLLIDDVFTTGATAAACARSLKRAGAAQVSLLTLARTDRRKAFDALQM